MRADRITALWSVYGHKLLPFLAWINELKHWPTLRADLIAGFTVAMLLIPQSMAYAHLAGVPVYMGLYAGFLPPIVAALFGSSRILSTGPVPVASLLTAVAIQPLAVAGSEHYIQLVLLLTLLAGITQLALGFLRFGVVVNFISYPVTLGFINAIAIIIASMQLGNLLGVYVIKAPHFYQIVWQVLMDAWDNIHWPTVGIAFLGFVVILGGRKWWPDLPHTLIAVVLTTTISWLTGFEKKETVNVEQIINLPVRQMLENYELYPRQMQTLLDEIEKSEKKGKKIAQKIGEHAHKADEVLRKAMQAKWELQRLVARHQFEVGELNRLHFRRMYTDDHRELYFAAEQMTPIGDVEPDEWRIAEMSDGGQLVLQSGGAVVGAIPSGLPIFKPVIKNWDVIAKLFVPALVIALIGFTEAATIAKRIAAENRQRLDINQEFIGQGLAKCVGSFFQSMPVSGGFSRSAVNFYAGAKTGFSSITAGIIVMVVLLWLTPLFYYLPYATLAVVIMVGVLGLLDVKEMIRIWKISRKEGLVTGATFILTLVLAPNVALGIIVAMLLSLGFYLYDSMKPRFIELTRQDGELVEITEADKEETCYLISVVRFYGSLYFGNAAYFENKLLKLISDKQKLRYIILDCMSMNKLDATGVETIRNICSRLEEVGIEMWFTRVRRPVMSALKRGGVYDSLGQHYFYSNNDLAIHKLSEDLGPKHMNTCPLSKKS